MKRPRDSQRSKLYKWELEKLKSEDLIGPEDNTPLGEAGAQKLVRETWAAYCPELGDPPTVRVMNNRGRGCGGSKKILLSGWYKTTQTRWYVLHELAHSITLRRKFSGAWHGPEFAALYANLLHRFTTANRAKIVGSMRNSRLKVGK